MCRVDDGEPWEFFQSATRRAAKPYRCDECRRVIAKGESYRYGAGKYDGFFSTHRTCLHCQAASTWLITACGGWVRTELFEELQEHWDEEPDLRSWTLARLLVSIRRQWRDGAMAIPDEQVIRDSVPVEARS